MELGQRVPVTSEMLGQDRVGGRALGFHQRRFCQKQPQPGANLPKQGILALKEMATPDSLVE